MCIPKESSSPLTRVALYARSAHEPHWELGRNVTSQLVTLRAFVREKGWIRQGEYQDTGISGLDLHRPGLTQLLSSCRVGHVDVVVITDLSRLSRSLPITAALLRQFRLMKVCLVRLDDIEFVPPHDTG